MSGLYDIHLPLSAQEMRALGLYVPGLLIDLEAEFGADVMKRAACLLGGKEFYVAEGRGAVSLRIERQLGTKTARWITDNLGHGHVVYPLGPASRRSRTYARIVRQLAAGMDANEIAASTGMHRRQVLRVKAKFRDRGVDLT